MNEAEAIALKGKIEEIEAAIYALPIGEDRRALEEVHDRWCSEYATDWLGG